MDALAANDPHNARAGRLSYRPTRISLVGLAFAIILLALAAYFTIASLSGSRNAGLVKTGGSPADLPDILKLMSPSERQSLIAREQGALRANSLDRSAIRNLALLWRADDDQAKAEQLVILAGNRSLRDLRAQGEVLDILLRRKDFGAALYRIDALIRAQPERQADLLKVAAPFAESDESRSALVAALAKGPPWRQALISTLVKSPSGPAIAYNVLSELRKTGTSPSQAELRELLAVLIAKRDYDTAYFVWLDFLSPTEARKAENIYDGGFDFDAQNLLFGWNFGKVRNTDIRLIPRSTSSADRMLRVEFLNTRDRFEHVSQILHLSPGFYNLTGEIKAERLATEVGLVWRTYCLGEKERPITATGKLFAASTWAPFETAFEVPAQDCTAQRLRLEVDSKAALDQLISGQVYFDNLKIAKSRSGS